MAEVYPRTSMGGHDSRFYTTCWTIIADSKTDDETRNQLIINDLMSRYWKPVYCYLRRKGHDNESAKDLTQGFSYEVVLGRELIKKADKKKGKFRTFLLGALDRYVIDVHRKEVSTKRSPKGEILSLDEIDLPEPSYKEQDYTPEDEFHRAWVAEMLDQVLSEVEQECQRTNKEIHWKVFIDRVLTPILEGTKPPSLPDICRKYGVENESQTSNLIKTVKRRLRKYLERHLEQIVGSGSEVEAEISQLLKTLTQNRAR